MAKCVVTGEETKTMSKGMPLSKAGRDIIKDSYPEFINILKNNKLRTVSLTKFTQLCRDGVEEAFANLDKVLEEMGK